MKLDSRGQKAFEHKDFHHFESAPMLINLQAPEASEEFHFQSMNTSIMIKHIEYKTPTQMLHKRFRPQIYTSVPCLIVSKKKKEKYPCIKTNLHVISNSLAKIYSNLNSVL